MRLPWIILCSCLVTAPDGLPARAQDQVIRRGGTRLDVDIYGNIYLLDAERSMLVMIDNAGRLLREVGGTGWGTEEFDQPSGIWARNGINVFVADYGNHRIQRFDRTLSYVSSFNTRESDRIEDRFGYPADVAVSRLGDLFICDGENVRILKVNRFSQADRTFGGFGGGKGRLRNPTRLEVGPKDQVYVLDDGRIVVFDTFGNYLRELADGLFKEPTCIFADENRVAVVDKSAIHWFDSSERPVLTTAISLLPILGQEIHDFAATGGKLYLLASDSIHIVPDPSVQLDKEVKSP